MTVPVAGPPVPWPIFIAIVAACFLANELWAYYRSEETFSQYVWSRATRFVAFFLGVVIGVLAVHFWGDGFCPS